MKVAFYSLGCKVNTYETEAVMELFIEKGYEIVGYDSFSDVYIVNSCMVTNAGEKKSKNIIRRPLQINPLAIVIVMGCLSQMKATEILKIEGVKIVLGTKNRDRIIVYLEEYIKEGKVLNKVNELEEKEVYDSLAIVDFHHQKRAFLKIQDGCNNFCTYCIIPYTRGRIRSKTKAVIMDEITNLVNNGHIEVVLTGIHTGGYGVDLIDYSFKDLLVDLDEVEGLKRIRISSIEITELTEEILEVIKKSKTIVHHLHVPLQSGSDRILELMNRKYTTSEYEAAIKKIRDYLPDASITTDVIVGFPSETESDFQEVYQFVKKMEFSELHVFPYSRREGTLADKMSYQIDGSTKKDRVKKLLDLSDELRSDFLKKNIGKHKLVIVEQEKDGFLVGHTKDYLALKFLGKKSLIGKEVLVKIDNSDKPFALATIV
jgi:threonylcarbamoyladenosine tRNA methylthiotransferase MtaB